MHKLGISGRVLWNTIMASVRASLVLLRLLCRAMDSVSRRVLVTIVSVRRSIRTRNGSIANGGRIFVYTDICIRRFHSRVYGSDDAIANALVSEELQGYVRSVILVITGIASGRITDTHGSVYTNDSIRSTNNITILDVNGINNDKQHK